MKSNHSKSSGAPKIVPAPSTRQPTHDEISAFARSHWEKSGRPTGRDMEIWLEAERRLRAGMLGNTDDAASDTRALLGEQSNSIGERLAPFGDKGGDRSATSL